MNDKIKIKRGLSTNLPKLDTGEFGLSTDTNELHIGNILNNLKVITSTDVVDNLISGGSKVPLSAEQGKLLNEDLYSLKDNQKAYLNLVTYAKENKINTKSDWTLAIKSAIDYCKLNKKNLYIPNGEYIFTESTLEIINEGELGLDIVGENIVKTVLKFTTNGIKLSNQSQVLEYQKRISHIRISNLTIRKATTVIPYNGIGIDISKFGYIELDRVRIRDFKEGLKLNDGSEFDMRTSQILGNDIGIHLVKPTIDGTSDLANINFWGCRVHNNNQTIVADAVREVNFNQCALMNYTGGMTFNGICNMVNFNGCDLENQAGTNDLIINATSGTFNLIGCVLANPQSKKILLKDGSNATLNLIGCVIDNTISKVIFIENGFKGQVNTDNNYNNYFIDSDKDFNNYSKGDLMNFINWDFSKQNVAPYGVNALFTVDTVNYVTGNCSLSFNATNDEKYISMNMNYLSGVPTSVELIVSGNTSDNIVRLVYKDGTSGYNYAKGGSDIRVQEFSNGFKKVIAKLPKHIQENPITAIQIVLRNNTTQPKIDSVRIYGTGVQGGDKLYSSLIPTSGIFTVGELLYNKTITELGSSGSKYIIPFWVCTATPSTFAPCKVLTGN